MCLVVDGISFLIARFHLKARMQIPPGTFHLLHDRLIREDVLDQTVLLVLLEPLPIRRNLTIHIMG